MTSILLYEAWLFSKPVISLQPDVIREDLKKLYRKRDEVICLTDKKDWKSKISEFIIKLSAGSNPVIRKELQLHTDAADNIANSLCIENEGEGS
jgi:hypothetical protein